MKSGCASYVWQFPAKKSMNEDLLLIKAAGTALWKLGLVIPSYIKVGLPLLYLLACPTPFPWLITFATQRFSLLPCHSKVLKNTLKIKSPLCSSPGKFLISQWQGITSTVADIAFVAQHAFSPYLLPKETFILFSVAKYPPSLLISRLFTDYQ